MNNIFNFSAKLKTISKIVAVFVIVSVLMPSAILSSPSTVSAEESAVSSSESSESSDSSTPSDTPSDSGDTSSNEGSSTGPSTTEGGDAGANTPQTVPQKPADAPQDAATNTGGNGDVVADVANESSGGGSSGNRSAELAQSPAGATGSITFCTMIADINGNVKTNATGLHPGSFHIKLINGTSTETRRIIDSSTIGGEQFQPFTPNQRILPSSTVNDADCKTFSNLPLGVDYYYTQQTVTGVAVNAWQTPKYNDQYETVVETLADFYSYSPELFDDIAMNDGRRNLDSDGYFIPLTPERSSRTLVILNRYTPGNQAPVLTLNGSNPTTVVIGQGYHEAHAIATDDWDDVTPRIQMTGVVDDQTVGRYELVYTVTDGGDHNLPPSQRVGLSDTETRVINVVAADPDVNQAPVITLLGDNPMRIVVGGTFTEPGYTAVDPDGSPTRGPLDLTRIVNRSGTVNTNTIGSYDLTYTVADFNSPDPGNDQKVRRVNVVAADDNGNGGGGGGGGGGGSSGGRSRRNSNNNGNNNNGGQVLGAETGPVAPCNYISDYMRRDWENNTFEVLKLQSFLKHFEGFADLQQTGVFDQATFDAVSTFQARYGSDILAPWGYDNSNSTGFVYILTKKKINEIFCQNILTLTAVETQEIAGFRSQIGNMQTVAATITASETNSNLKDIAISEDGSVKDINSIKDIFSSETSSTTAVVSVDDSFGSRFKPENIKAMASAIFSVPNDRGMMLQSLYFLLIALIAIYLLTEIIVGSMDTSKLTRYQVWSRKATCYVLCLIVAILVAVWYRIFSIVIPLILLAIASGASLAWAITRRSGDQVISLPQSSQFKK